MGFWIWMARWVERERGALVGLGLAFEWVWVQSGM